MNEGMSRRVPSLSYLLTYHMLFGNTWNPVPGTKKCGWPFSAFCPVAPGDLGSAPCLGHHPEAVSESDLGALP